MIFGGVVHASGLVPGSPAPMFELTDQYGKTHRLEDYRGHWLVIYFYPRDDTPGCTREACAFRDDYAELKRMNVALVGVSLDDEESHRSFAQKYGLPFPLLADTGGQVASAYGALWKLGPIRFARRNSFIVDPEGRIAKIYRTVKASRHSDEVISTLKSLGAETPTRADQSGG